MKIENGTRSWTWELRPPRVLVAENDDSTRAELCGALRADGYDVVEAHDGDEVLDSLLAFPPGPVDCIDVIVATEGLASCDSGEVRERLRGMKISTPVVVVAGARDLGEVKGAVFRLTHAFS